jgi:membrane-associated protein
MGLLRCGRPCGPARNRYSRSSHSCLFGERREPHLDPLAPFPADACVLSWWSVWLAAVSADVLADTLLYALGRHGGQGRWRRVPGRLGLTDQRRDALTARVHTHLPQVVISAKLVDLGAVPAFLAAGLAGVGLRRFLSWAVPATMVRSGVLVGFGFLAGARFTDDLISRPWLLAVGGLAIGVALIVGRAATTRLAGQHSHVAR